MSVAANSNSCQQMRSITSSLTVFQSSMKTTLDAPDTGGCIQMHFTCTRVYWLFPCTGHPLSTTGVWNFS